MGIANPNFPTKVWDGLTDRDGNLSNKWRDTLVVNRPPNAKDWDQIVAEMRSLQVYVLALTGGTTPSAVADENINIGDLVKVKTNERVVKADATTSLDIVGMALTSAISGSVLQYATSGSVINLSWNLSPGSIYYLAAAGQLSLTPPSTGWVIQLGQSLAQQVFNLNIQQAIRL